MEPDGSSPCSQEPVNEPYSEPADSIQPLTRFLRSILILSFHLYLSLPTIFSLHVFQLICCMNVSRLLCVLHVLSLPFSLIWSQ